MTPREFKAWFDGFTEAFSGTPTKAQWARIKDRVGEIDGSPVTERVFIDRYWYATSPTYTLPRFTATNTCAVGHNATTTAVFNSSAAMNALGRADAQSLAA
jgi:hypothetical protein